MPPKICSTSVEHPHLGEHLWATISICQKKYKIPKFKKFLFAVVKINLLTLKMNK